MIIGAEKDKMWEKNMDKKTERIISLYKRIISGEVIYKAEEAARFGVNEKSIQRDIEDLRAHFSKEPGNSARLIYDRTKKGYLLVDRNLETLTNSEILVVSKILLESRSLVSEEMMPIIDKLVKNCVPYDQFQKVRNLISNEKYHYLEPHHGVKFVEKMWQIGSAVNEHRLVRIRYHKLKKSERINRLIQPVGIMFSEYYFYLCAYICKNSENPDLPKYSFPTTYRIDRIEDFDILEEHFTVPYTERFEEGEFRKRVQFMYGGELRTIRFRYKGLSIEAILDRLPTAVIVDQDENSWIVEAEVYGDGVNMWLRSQGENIEMLK